MDFPRLRKMAFTRLLLFFPKEVEKVLLPPRRSLYGSLPFFPGSARFFLSDHEEPTPVPKLSEHPSCLSLFLGKNLRFLRAFPWWITPQYKLPGVILDGDASAPSACSGSLLSLAPLAGMKFFFT